VSGKLRFWLGLGLTALSLFALAQSVDLQKTADALVGVDYLWLAPAVLVIPPTVWTRAVRWRQLFVPNAGLRVSKLFAILMIGYLINSVLPARLGDPARAFLAADFEGVRPAQGIATVVAERLLDVLTLVGILLLITQAVALPDWMQRSGTLLGAGAFGGFVALLVLGRRRERFLPLASALAARLPRIRPETASKQIDYLLSGLDALSSWRNAAGMLFLCSLIWAFAVVQAYLVMFAFDIVAPPWAAATVVVVTALGMVVPSTPGYLGVFHYLTVVALGLYGVESNLALSYAIVLHVVTFLPLSLFGLFYLWRESLSLGKVSARASRLH
jgi:uncharacterized protein (TIRG00374 family)